jgi:hypothetical protein
MRECPDRSVRALSRSRHLPPSGWRRGDRTGVGRLHAVHLEALARLGGGPAAPARDDHTDLRPLRFPRKGYALFG